VSRIVYLLFFLIVAISCASKQNTVEKETIIPKKPQILFLNYTIYKDKSGEKSIRLINKIKTEGRLKTKNKDLEKTTIGDIEYHILDGNSQVLEKISLKNPLLKTLEFINDFGKFEKRIIDLDSSQFTIRLQLDPKAKYISISELTKMKLRKHITSKIN